MQESTHRMRKSALQAVLSRMQLTLHRTRRLPHGASRMVHAIATWSMNTGRASAQHCRDARVYRHTATAMHENDYPPPRPLNRYARVTQQQRVGLT